MNNSHTSTRIPVSTAIVITLLCGFLFARDEKRSNMKGNNQVVATTQKGKRTIKNKKAPPKQTTASQPESDSVTNKTVNSTPVKDSSAEVSNDPVSFWRVTQVESLGLSEWVEEGKELKKRGKRFDEPDEAAEYFLLKRLPEGERELPVEKYFEAQEQMQQMRQYSTALDRELPSRALMKENDPDQQKLGTWTALGPGNIGGRTRAIVIHPQDTNIMYAAGVSGGVWKSTDAGGTWIPITDLIANIPVSSLALDPANPNVVYAGTGEGYAIGSVNNVNIPGAHRGLGIYKTTDGGSNWARLADTANPNFYYVNDLVVSARDSQRIYAATDTGVWRSLNGGANWTRVLNTTGGGGPSLFGGCLDLAIRTDQETDIVFASCGTRSQARVYRNTNAGAGGTWDEVLTETLMGRTALAIAPSNQNTIYAISTAFTGMFANNLHAVFRSTSGGDSGSWTARVRNDDPKKLNRAILSVPPQATATDCKIGSADQFIGQGFYDLAIAVDPLDENRVWVGGIDLFRSDDGGANWGLAGYSYNLTPGGGANIGKTHPDQHIIVFHPQYNGTTNQQMFVGNDGGLYRTDNARADVGTAPNAPCNFNASSVAWTPLNNNYGVTQFYQGTVHPAGTAYYGGTQDNGTVLGTDGAGVNKWNMILGGDGGYGHFDFLNPTTLYASSQGPSLRKSTDNGATFSAATFGITQGGLFITPTAIDPSDPRRLYYGASTLFRTSNGASLWTSITPSVLNNLISAIAIAPTDANTVMVAAPDGMVFRTSRILTYTPLTVPSPPTEVSARPRAGFVSWLAFDPTNKNIAYATYSTFGGGAHVWRTMNGGASWGSIDGSGAGMLPDIPVHCIVVDPSNTSRLYIGTDLGVFVSTDGGLSWSVENTGFANVVTESLVINVANGVTTLYAFTHGRGAFKVTANMSGCNFSLSSTGRSFGRQGGDATVDVTVNPGGCNWIAESNVPWITVGPGAGGSSNGSVALRIEANNNFGNRVGTVNIAGRSFTVTQEGVIDLDAPMVAINSPATPTVDTTAGTITISGTSFDNVRVSSVNWRSDRGTSGVAALASPSPSGQTAWAIPGLPLVTGRNVIIVTAVDDNGNVSSPATIIVNSMPSSVLATVAGSGVSGFSGEGGPAVLANMSLIARIATDNAGNLYICDYGNFRVRKMAPDGVITTVAGNGTSGFSGDGGQAKDAQLNFPVGVALDNSGNIYISDYVNHRVRKVTVSTGVITTVAGTGVAGFAGDNGPATSALLNFPEGLAIDSAGNLYIADSANNRVRKVNASDGVITTIAGTGVAGFGGDTGPATNALLRNPLDVFIDNANNIYISDGTNYRIRKINASDGIINTVVGSGTMGAGGDGGPAIQAQLNFVIGIKLDSAGNMYLADTSNQRVRRVAADTGIISTIAGGAAGFSPDGSGAVGARLGLPSGVAIDPMGMVLFSDRSNFRVRKIVPALPDDRTSPTVQITSPTTGATYTATDSPLTLSGTASDNGTVVQVRWSNDRGGGGLALGTTSWTVPVIGLANGLNNISVFAWDVSGNVSSANIAVTFNVQQAIITIAGTGISGSSGDNGPATAANLSLPRGLTLDSGGNIIFADTSNRRVRRVSPTGMITAFAGNGELGSGGDGGPAVLASMNSPTGVAIDSAGNIYISDSNINRVRKVTTDGNISTVAGTGVADSSGDGGAAKDASLAGPQQVAIDTAGNLYIAETANHRIRKVNASDGKISTFAGTGLIGFSGDGEAATQAEFSTPTGLAVDGGGNVYIADVNNQRIRRVNASDGKINTIAGTGSAGYNGDGIAAKDAQLNLSFPSFLSIDPSGDLIIADRSNHRIRKITLSTGMITTIAGNGTPGSFGDGSSPTGANLLFPTAAIVDARGNLYISDSSNNRIRRTTTTSALRTVSAVSAASFITAGDLASDAIAAVFGNNLAYSSQSATTIPLPNTLAGTTINVRDNLGIDRLAPLFFVMPGQINLAIPNGTANGLATITVTNDKGEISTGIVNIATVAPGLFAANMNGQGVAAAVVLRRNASGQDTYEPVSRLDPATNQFVSVPIDVSNEGDQVFLIPFGTAFRNRSSLANVTATIGGMRVPVLYVGPTPGLIGLDQANLRLDRSLAGLGEVDIVFTVDGKMANVVKVNIK